ncbi:MAG: type II toxin-antitoxin system PemK/MazF family toxin [Acidobacteriaceae bacterium]|nr:type II toxin-antitoxin system PemK/MazF family toxin [Acidobacteriaceae bacterium]
MEHPSTIIYPFTTNVKKDASVLRVAVDRTDAGLERGSEILVDQIRSIDNRRFGKQIGKISSQELVYLRIAVSKILDIPQADLSARRPGNDTYFERC